MKRIAALTLALLMVFALTACGEETETAETEVIVTEAPADAETAAPVSEAEEPTETEAAVAEVEAAECTPEDYDIAIDALTETTGAPTRTYADVVALFGGVEGTVNTDMEYEGYSYYNWTDGTRTALVTFKVNGEEETYFAITGDIQ
ncbi:MAG: lipoprotein [Christensenellales bacterium]|jgi:uncharacterized protein (DUF2147 family)